MAESLIILWWGRFDPDYSRNRILRQLMEALGWSLRDFSPVFSRFGDIQATVQRVGQPDIVWVPCFRQRDMVAASRWARRMGVPLVFDPLISAYDKQVDERRKLKVDSRQARHLLRWERDLFASADRVVADTPAHADYFHEMLGVPRDRLSILMVGAEEQLFQPCSEREVNDPLEVLFFGSFIPLQDPEVIVEAARLCEAKDVVWTLLGNGPLRQRCEERAQGLTNIRFEDWLPYRELPERICKADILLGIFGDTPKAGRVIPNKVYQGLASAKPLVTRESAAYPKALLEDSDSGISWVPAANARALAWKVARLATDSVLRKNESLHARKTMELWFSSRKLKMQLQDLLSEAL